ncbi:PepSY-associated TM helix domain-containing protein [Thermithiobacillus plumbiphilus]|uniref:PepSY-associated TM helix domain-containing protein n=1 Tax=Thermithiobacillus plumbiphilus TaxID=1729899 RepID=A0ABU9D9Z5_9PROT
MKIEAIPRIDTGKRQETGYLFMPKAWRRGRFLVWLRRTHAWLGLWGAALGLLFGLSGFLLNHRQEMKIPAAQQSEIRQSISPPAGALKNPKALEAWARETFEMQDARGRSMKKPAAPAPWGNGSVIQPAHWQVNLNSLNQSVSVDYWQGNRMVAVEVRKPNLWATLTRLHKGAGMPAAWVLFADTLAGALMMLALTGTLLWSRLHGPRLLALGLVGGCLTLGLVIVSGAL